MTATDLSSDDCSKVRHLIVVHVDLPRTSGVFVKWLDVLVPVIPQKHLDVPSVQPDVPDVMQLDASVMTLFGFLIVRQIDSPTVGKFEVPCNGQFALPNSQLQVPKAQFGDLQAPFELVKTAIRWLALLGFPTRPELWKVICFDMPKIEVLRLMEFDFSNCLQFDGANLEFLLKFFVRLNICNRCRFPAKVVILK